MMTMPKNGSKRPQREVLVRYARTEAYENAVLGAQAVSVLGDEELRILARLRPPAARRDYLAAHALARTTLAEFAGCDPRRLRFHSWPFGRPEPVTQPGARPLSFSISHTDGLALCAVSAGCPVGADVESRRNVETDPLGVARRVCSEKERNALRALTASERVDRLLYLWTFKEAVAKVRGLGFCLPLNYISVDDACPWQVTSSRLTTDHVASVAVLFPREGRPVAIRFEEVHTCVSQPDPSESQALRAG